MAVVGGVAIAGSGLVSGGGGRGRGTESGAGLVAERRRGRRTESGVCQSV